MPKVVVTDLVYSNAKYEKEILAPLNVELIVAYCKKEEEVIRISKDADVLLVCYAPITKKVMRSLAKCKGMIRYGVGVDNIDVEAATARGILVINVPHYGAENEVSSHALGLLLCAARKILFLDRKVRQGIWDYREARPIYRIEGSTLGLVGFGSIGKMLARKVKGLEMKVIAYDPYRKGEEFEREKVKRASLEELLQRSDYVSIHVPLNEETHHLIGERQLRMMKRTAVLINTARGGVVDSQALYLALRNKWIRSACLDVIENGPLNKDHSLLQLDNVIITPHSGFYSEQSCATLQRIAAEEASRLLRGELPRSVVNEEAVARFLSRSPSAKRDNNLESC